jgi:hypothetical protein
VRREMAGLNRGWRFEIEKPVFNPPMPEHLRHEISVTKNVPAAMNDPKIHRDETVSDTNDDTHDDIMYPGQRVEVNIAAGPISPAGM